MKRHLAALPCLLFLLILPVSAGASGVDGLLQGFRGMAWGTDLAALPQMKRVLTGDKTAKTYMILNDDPAFAGLPFQRILYGFFEKKLFRVTLETTDNRVAANLTRLFYQSFGPPTQNEIEDFNDVSVWRTRDLEIRNVYKENDRISVTIVSYRPLLEKSLLTLK